jgi:hypothetical protein
MTKAARTRLKAMVTILCLAWLAGAGVLMWATLPEVEHHGSSAVKDRMANECQGTFSERYKCKEAIIVESGREGFWMVSARFLLVIVPPMVFSVLLSGYLRRNPVQIAERHVADDSWKTRAQQHITRQADHQDMPPIGPLDGKHHPIDDIAPLDDWKTRAQQHTTKRRE